MRREIIRDFEKLNRKQILATRSGLWGDYELLDVIVHFQQERDRDRAMAVAELMLRSPEHGEMVDYQGIYFDVVEYYRRQDNATALSWAHAMIVYSEQHEPGLNRITNWRDLGEVYLSTDDLETGLRMFARILRADPNDIWTYNILGLRLPWAGLYQLALEVLDKALRLVEESDPEGLKDQLTRIRREAVDKQAHADDRMSEVDPDVLAEFRDSLTLSGKRKTARRKVRPGRRGEGEAPTYLPPVDQLLSLGAVPDDSVYAEMLDQGKVLIPELIWMAFDPQLHAKPADDPAHHAPAHAVALLRELRTEAELDRLAPWLDHADGDWYTELLTERCGKVGGYTTDQLETMAADTTYDLMIRSSAATALAERVNRVPAERNRIVTFMRELLNRPEAHELPEEETFVGFLIGDILDMDARELYPDIKQAYEEDRVDTKVVRLGDVHHEWGMKPVRGPERRSDGMHLRLRCKECGREREHFVQHVLVDTPTLQRQAGGEDVQYDPYIMDREITCPKCGAVDRYEMTPQGHVALMGPAAMPKLVSLFSGEEPPADLPSNPRVHHMQMLAFGRPMHPFAALDEYRKRIAEKPNNADLRLKLGNVLRSLGRHADALVQYRQAYNLDPENAEMALTRGMCAHDTGDRETAKAMYERVVELSDVGMIRRIIRRDPSDLSTVAIDGLARLKRNQPSPWAAPWEREEATPPKDVGEDEPEQGSGGGKRKKRKRRRRRRRRRRK